MSDQEIKSLNDGELLKVSGGAYNGPVFVYIMKDGDTLESVAAHYHTTASVLAELNNISNPAIPLTGRQIYVPSNF
jgi:LysM repeat protein